MPYTPYSYRIPMTNGTTSFYRIVTRKRNSPRDVVAHPRDVVPVLHRTLTQTSANNSKRRPFHFIASLFVLRIAVNLIFPSPVFGLITTDPSQNHAQLLLPIAVVCCSLHSLCIIPLNLTANSTELVPSSFAFLSWWFWFALPIHFVASY